MNTIKYIGMDVHLATISIAVLDAKGKLLMEVTIATQAGALLDLIGGLRGSLHVTFEEGTSAHWLYTVLEPHVATVVVCDPRQNARRLGEKKSDRLDARKLAEGLRMGSLKPVYHGNALVPALKELVRSYRNSGERHDAGDEPVEGAVSRAGDRLCGDARLLSALPQSVAGAVAGAGRARSRRPAL